MTYDGKTESAKLGTVDEAALPGLDPQLAAYPFPQLEGWKALTGAISSAVVKRVLGELEVVDSLTGEAGGDEIGALREALGAQRNKAAEAAEKDKGAADKATTASATTATSTSTSTETKSEAKVETKTKDTAADSEKHVLQYPVFDLKRSWPADARGDELSRWSRDKSALLAKVCKDVGGELIQSIPTPRSNPTDCPGPAALLGHLQLSFALTTNVWNFASLGAYKRIVSLFTQSPAAMAGTCPAEFDFGAGGSHAALQKIYLALLGTMTAQLKSLPPTAFDTELPDLDTFYLAQLDHLRQGLGAALAEKSWWGLASRVASDWAALQKVGKERGWAIEDMRMGDEDSDAEEGEYAPMVVEM